MIEYFLPLVEALLNLFGPRTPSADEEVAWKNIAAKLRVGRWRYLQCYVLHSLRPFLFISAIDAKPSKVN